MAEPHKSDCYCMNLRRSANAVSDFYDAGLKEAGVTVPQYYLLINLSRLGRANITHWAAQVALDRSTMVRNARPLEARGWIEKTEGRGKTFAVSPAGKAILNAAIPIWLERQKKLEAYLGKADAEAVLRVGWKLQLME